MAGSHRTGRSIAVFREVLETALRPRGGKDPRSWLSCRRQLSSSRTPQTLKTLPSLSSTLTVKQQRRPFMNLAAPLFGASKRTEYAEAHQLGYSVEQMYDIVADVASYRFFVPWCTGSRLLTHRSNFSRAELEVGFPPVVERYISEVSLVPHRQIRAVSKDGRLFQHLEMLWQFGPGRAGHPDTCTLSFYVSFEFRSILHSQLANLFFDEVVKQMVSAFEHRAEKLYGPQAAVWQRKTAFCT
ncbi:coenzyme Q-binding protein COQ10 homolog B, mitochondrial-like [Sphaerodactylus townsendi]|uniref:coenzyme Q-binding protein COQ10 homolog B, mitochondrial-like n=1 Tax=Sphaerodactylus townsendi TaxID=933632 RepID=UPI0020274AA1|nr:coenzyme Q-binding protein COQ10 homolog B, mitochondrial-like [Sphaerodactylus townsendi]